MSSMSSVGSKSIYSCSSDGVVESWRPQLSRRQRRTTLPELLQLRQTHGLSQQRKIRGYGPLSDLNPHHVASTPYLSYRGAWNPTRMQNTILVVGPGTPASTVRTTRVKAQSGTARNGEEENEESDSLSSNSIEGNGEHDGEEEGEDEIDSSEVEAMEDEERMGEEDDDTERDPDDDNEDDNEHDDDSGSEGFYEFLRNNYGNINDEEDLSSDEEPVLERRNKCHYRPSMRHSGCINTAAWLTSECGWRLSTVTDEGGAGVRGIETEELSHQIVTSGDDHLLKVWDVSEPMGTSSPLAGGTATLTPFSSSYNVEKNFYKCKERWQSMYDARRTCGEEGDACGNDYRAPGTVRLLTTVSTGHRGNVFHVTPLRGRPGVFATCAADGFLRLVDVERSGPSASNNSRDLSTVVIHPMYDRNTGGAGAIDSENPLAYYLRNSSGMCFSHVMLDGNNIGLLCSEKGLLRFDLRLSPREQCTNSLLPVTARSSRSILRTVRACKACAVLPTSSGGDSGNLFGETSTYVFAGGSSPSVALCDLRMTATPAQQRSSGSRVLQYYKPMSLSEENPVSVSGLDLCRDGKELLVSYESDQIYTFPIFPYSESPRRSATDQLTELLNSETLHSENETIEEDKLYPWGQGKRILPELASYGAHLNRYTFLKNARYAGPRDEYICTGSDSGHAWVYEKATGAVVSFWKADESTCNGVVPHPTLPIFVSYGIDSTAKLWRSTTPVDSEVDDGAVGRRKHFRMTQERSYKMTPTVRSCERVREILEDLNSRDNTDSEIFADQIPCENFVRLVRVIPLYSRASSRNPTGRQGIPKIGNDLHNLPDALKANSSAVIRSLFEDNDVPVESDTEDFKRRVSLIRLRHQADSLGLTWNPNLPWLMEGHPTVDRTEKIMDGSAEDRNVDRSELVPEYPSDWIPYDAEMSNDPFHFRDNFCGKYNFYNDFYRDRYYALDETGFFSNEGGDDTTSGDSDEVGDYNNETTQRDEGNNMKTRSIKEEESSEGKDELLDERDDDDEEGTKDDENSDASNDFTRNSNRILAETVKTLKDGGNAAFKAGKLGLAAYRYDKAIQYGFVAFMKSRRRGILRFDSLLKNLVMTRLNIALVLLNEHFMELQVARKQAKLALEEVSPFCDPQRNENQESLDEALALKAKACFRLGSAQYELGDYHDSIASLEESIKSTSEISKSKDNTPDSLVLKRLALAKREYMKQSKRQRKKFKFAFGQSTSESPSKLDSESATNSGRQLKKESTCAQELSSPTPSQLPVADESLASIEGANLTVPNPMTQAIPNSVTPMNSPATGVETGLISSATTTNAPSLPDEERNA